MPFATEREGAPERNRSRMPRGRRGRHARARERVDGVPRAPDRELHGAALPRRRREHPRGASRCAERRCRSRSPRCSTTTTSSPSTSGSAPRRARPRARLRRRRTRRPTSDGHVRFTAPSVVFRRGEDIRRRRRLAATPLLRHASRELRTRARARAAAGLAGAAARVLPGRADDGRGRAPPRRGLRSRSRSGSRGGFAVRARRRWEGGSSRVGQRCPLESSLVSASCL